jgi:putative OmpL-like beta-barrel porin-2
MLGVNASYPLTDKITGAPFIVNGYWHLADANNVPSSGGQLTYKATDRWTLKQTVLYGPHQSDTSLEFWRFLSDSIAEWKGKRATTVFEYIIGGEKIATTGKPRAIWMAAQLPMRWVMNPRFSVAIRPEVYWDRDGRTTGSAQLVKAFTSTVAYRIPGGKTSTILRLEHRFDDSRGKGGGFYNDGAQGGAVGLKPSQHLLIVAAIFTFDAIGR